MSAENKPFTIYDVDVSGIGNVESGSTQSPIVITIPISIGFYTRETIKYRERHLIFIFNDEMCYLQLGDQHFENMKPFDFKMGQMIFNYIYTNQIIVGEIKDEIDGAIIGEIRRIDSGELNEDTSQKDIDLKGKLEKLLEVMTIEDLLNAILNTFELLEIKLKQKEQKENSKGLEL